MNYSIPNMGKAIGIITLGVIFGAAGVYIGEVDDAPGMMLIGMLLIIGSSAYGMRTALRRS